MCNLSAASFPISNISICHLRSSSNMYQFRSESQSLDAQGAKTQAPNPTTPQTHTLNCHGSHSTTFMALWAPSNSRFLVPACGAGLGNFRSASCKLLLSCRSFRASDQGRAQDGSGFRLHDFRILGSWVKFQSFRPSAACASRSLHSRVTTA